MNNPQKKRTADNDDGMSDTNKRRRIDPSSINDSGNPVDKDSSSGPHSTDSPAASPDSNPARPSSDPAASSSVADTPKNGTFTELGNITVHALARRYFPDAKLELLTKLARELAAKPAVRETQLRPPKVRKGGLNIDLRGNLDSLFAHLLGTEPPEPCKNCKKGLGPWSGCVVLEGKLQGACACCAWNGCRRRCSFFVPKKGDKRSQMARPRGMKPSAVLEDFPFLDNDPELTKYVGPVLEKLRETDPKHMAHKSYQIKLLAKSLAALAADAGDEDAGEEDAGEEDAGGAEDIDEDAQGEDDALQGEAQEKKRSREDGA